MVTGLIGSLVSAGANVGMGLYNAHKSAKEARAADARQYAYSLQSAREMPKAQRMGLEAAGYNPMLALGDIGGSSALASHQGTSNLSFDGASAKELGDFVQRLFKDKAQAEVDNIKADTELKKGQLDVAETQRLQNEANTSLLESQAERTALAYGRDIVDSTLGIVGTGASLYSAKAMADVAKANANVNARNASVNEQKLKQHKYEIVRDRKGNVTGTRDTHINAQGRPAVQSTPKGKPNAGGLGHSAKSVGRVAKDLAKGLVLPAWLAYPTVELRRMADNVEKNHPRGNRKKGYNFVPRLGF